MFTTETILLLATLTTQLNYRRYLINLSLEPLDEIKIWPSGGNLLNLSKEEMGSHGLVAVQCGQSSLLGCEKDVYDFFDNPKKELVRICTKETDLIVIDPLEVPPMGDCDLRKLKSLYGEKLSKRQSPYYLGYVARFTGRCKRSVKKSYLRCSRGGGDLFFHRGPVWQRYPFRKSLRYDRDR